MVRGGVVVKCLLEVPETAPSGPARGEVVASDDIPGLFCEADLVRTDFWAKAVSAEVFMTILAGVPVRDMANTVVGSTTKDSETMLDFMVSASDGRQGWCCRSGSRWSAKLCGGLLDLFIFGKVVVVGSHHSHLELQAFRDLLAFVSMAVRPSAASTREGA